MKKILQIMIFIYIIINSNLSFSNDIYETKFYHINVVTDNTSETKSNEINKVKIKSFENILNNILISEDYEKFLKKIEYDVFLNKITKNIIIENELIINDKYIADIKINFDKKEIINLLRKYNVNYADIISDPFLILSSYNEEFITAGLTNENIFYNNDYFNLLKKEHNLIKIKFPDLNPNDRFIIPYKKIVSKNIRSLSKISKKYNILIFILVIINKENNNFLDIEISLFSKESQDFEFIANLYLPNDNNLHYNFFLTLDNWWKKNNLIDNMKLNKIVCRIKSKDYFDLNYIKSKINNLSQFKSINIITIDYNNNIEEIEYYGDSAIFIKSLSLFNINIIINDECTIQSKVL